MERNVNYTVVGIFVSLVILAFAIFTIWLAGTHDNREYDRYTVLFDSAVNGLEAGSVVKYRGVSVGRVIAVKLVEDHPDLIKVNVEVDKSTPVRSSTKGALKPQGITGLSFVELKTDGTDTELLKKTKGEIYPVIKAEASQLDKFFDDAPEISSRLISLANNMNNITKKIDNLLSDESMNHIASAIENFNEVADSLNMILNEGNALSIASTIKNLEKTSKNLNVTVSSISKNQGSINRFSGEGLDEMTLLIRDTRETMDAIKNLAKTLNEEPSRVIFQPNYDGVKIKK